MSDLHTKEIEAFLASAEELCQTAKTAERNNQSLGGDNHYGNRFHKQLVRFVALEDGFLKLVKSASLPDDIDNKIHVCLDTITSTSRQGKKRQDALRELRLACNRTVLSALLSEHLPPSPKGEHVLPKAVVIPSKDSYLMSVVIQANACYEARCYDAASVMVRKLAESLIIAVYEEQGRKSDIQNGAGDFLMLGDLIKTILSDSAISLGRETKASLPKLKLIGDRAAHNRRYLATKADLDPVIPGLRVAVDDLLHLAKLK
jgi:hypothetical protein